MTEFEIKEELEDNEDVQDDDIGTQDDEQESDEQAPDEIESLATEIGWRPDGELDAKSFILKSRDIQDTMRGHIKEQKKQLTDLSNSVEALKIHNERVYKAEVNKLNKELETLKENKREAIEEGDVDRVNMLDEKIDGVKSAISKPEDKDKARTVNPDFDAWVENNKWYRSDPEMAEYADSIADQNPGAPFDRLLRLVSKKTKEMFPDKFEAPQAKNTSKTPSASAVESAGRKTSSSRFTKADLTPNQRSVMAQFVRQGIMTEKQYIADIQKMQ